MTPLNRRDFLCALPAVGAWLGLVSRQLEAPDPFRDPAWIARWKQAPRRPVWESPDPREQCLLAAIARGETLRIRYAGGRQPGSTRTISPSLLFESEGYVGRYLAAHCHARQAPRTFAVKLLSLA